MSTYELKLFFPKSWFENQLEYSFCMNGLHDFIDLAARITRIFNGALFFSSINALHITNNNRKSANFWRIDWGSQINEIMKAVHIKYSR